MKRIALLALLSIGCEGREPLLVVNLRTDFVPGVEVTEAVTHVRATPDGAPLVVATHALVGADSLVDGRQIADERVPRGTTFVTVELRGPPGVVASRTTIVEVTGDRAVTAVITRSCQGVRCPPAGEPEATECQGGLCVGPRCAPEIPEACPEPACEADGDCPAGPTCTSPACVAGACLRRADDDACGPDAVCAPDEGCVADPPDGGTPLDAGRPGDAGADAGPSDAGASADAGADGGPAPDAGVDGGMALCAAVCPGTCEGALCVITSGADRTCPDGVDCEVRCDLASECSGDVTCGDGACRVLCSGTGSCGGTVSCGASRDCRVECATAGACDTVRCGDGACDVTCSGSMTCRTVECGTGTHTISCSGWQSCADVLCGSGATQATISCSNLMACANVSCSATDCDIDCQTTSCATMDCSGACRCAATCSLTSCASRSCPGGCATSSGCMAGPMTGGCGC